MFLSILGLLLLQPCYSLAAFTETNDFPPPELERLTKVLPRAIVKSPEQFYADFHSDAARLNVSIASYADTCFDVFLAMELSPAESGVENEVWIAINRSTNLKELAENWKDALPLTHSALKSRKNSLTTMARKHEGNGGLLSAAKFIEEITNRIEPAFTAFLFEEDQRADVLKVAITKAAISYKQLDASTKKDLETGFCFSNTMRWINSIAAVTRRTQLFDRFWEVVGVNIDVLLRESDFYSAMDIGEVTAMMKQRANATGMGLQEYVDTCAETIAVMKPTEEDVEYFEMNGDQIRQTFGQVEFNSTEEMFDALQNESDPLTAFFSEKKEFFYGKLCHLTPKTREIFNKVEEELSLAMLQENNKRARQSNETINPLSAETERLWMGRETRWREFERVFCVQTTTESFLMENIAALPKEILNSLSRSFNL